MYLHRNAHVEELIPEKTIHTLKIIAYPEPA
jgi:hypothetical protein